MEEVLHYLELKNNYYEKFYTVTLKFIEQANQNQWEEIETFVDNRERILNIIHSFDFKISQNFQQLNLTAEDLDQYRDQVKVLMETRAEWAQRIVTLDLELIAKMDEMKNETIRELKKNVETNHQINSFSPPMKRPIKPRKDV